MAVRFDASGDYLVRNDPGAAFTFTCWVKQKGAGAWDRTFFNAWFGPTTSGSIATVHIGGDSGDVQLYGGGGGTIRTGVPTTDVWYFLAVTVTSPLGDYCIHGDFVGDGESIDVSNLPHASSYGSFGNPMHISDPSDWGNFAIANAKCWTRVLTNAQIETERYSEAVVDATNLWAYWPLTVHTDLTDAFADNDWTGAGTLSTEVDAPAFTGGATITPGSIFPTVTM